MNQREKEAPEDGRPQLQAKPITTAERDDEQLSFQDPDDPADPLNWSKKRKWTIVALLSVLSTIGTTATLTPTPAVPEILADFHSDNESYSTLLVSIWELGEGIGPFFIGPLSEQYGRVPVWHTANVLFALCSVGSALSNSIHMLIAFRFLNGLVLASITLSPTIVSDIFRREERATALSVAAMTPVIGPTCGPILGSVITGSIGWRWVFWIIAIAVAAFEAMSVFVLRETYRVKILRDRDHSSRANSGGEDPEALQRSMKKKLSVGIFLRAIKIWVFYPVVFVLALYLAIAYGYQYLVFTTFTEVLEGQYSFSDSIVGVAYLGIGIGSILGMITIGMTSDRYVKHKQQKRGAYHPSDRLPPIIFGTLIMAAGLFLYGWTAEKRVQWMAPIMGTALQGFGLVVILISTQAYLVDAFPVHAASASAAGSILRSVAGAVVPLGGPPLYKKLGLGWGNSLLGFTAVAFLVVPVLLLRCGGSMDGRGDKKKRL